MMKLPGRSVQFYRLLALLALFGSLVAVMGCARQNMGIPPNPSPIETATPDEVEVRIYNTVIRRLAGQDDTFGGGLSKATIYLLRATNDGAGDPSAGRSQPVLLSAATQEAITAHLSDLSSRIVWLDSFDAVPREPKTGWVAEQGVVIEVGTIRFETPDRALVPGSIYIAPMAAGGTTYIVERQGGQWLVTGTSGVDWRS